MAIEIIDLGTVAQDGADGDVAREAFEKVNANFAEHESEIDALVPRVTTVENEVGQLEIQAGQIQGDLTNLTESFNLLSSEVGSNTADIQNLENSREYILVPGEGITIDRTDPTTPIISSTGSSGSVWGQITGTLSDQLDLQEILDDKVDKIPGKQLSTEDFTTEDKSTLDDNSSKINKVTGDTGVTDGAGAIPYDQQKQYPAGTVGYKLNQPISGTDIQVQLKPSESARTLNQYLGKSTAVFISNRLTASELIQAQAGTLASANSAVLASFNEALTKLPCTVFFDEGIYTVDNTALPNLAKTGLGIKGSGSKSSVLKFTGAGVGLNLDAFQSGSASDPFAQQVNIEGMTFEGNQNIINIIDAQGLARCKWKDVNVREANSTSGIGFRFRGVMLSQFDGLYCSTDLQPMTSKPLDGLNLDEGRRATESIGHCSNNLFNSCYFEGLPVGVRMVRADQNTFVNGSPESCTTWGLIVGVNCRYNTFIGVGFENLNAAGGDISDAGISSQYLNCYSSKNLVIQGRDTVLRGGYHERVEVQSDARRVYVGGIVVKHWNTGVGGLFDSGVGTQYGSIYDSQTGAYLYPKKDRVGLSPTGSPYTYRNTTGIPIEVIVQAGTVTQVRKGDGVGDLWLTGNVTNGSHILLNGDVIEVSYSSAPAMSWRPLNSI